jgi:hypothetical protein
VKHQRREEDGAPQNRRAQKAAARPGGGQRTTVVPTSQLMAARLYQDGMRPRDRTPGVGPINGKETQ